MMLFSERYADYIVYGGLEAKDEICGEIEYRVKEKIANVLREFAEPQIVYPNRYDNWEVRTTAFESAIEALNSQLGFNCVDRNEVFHPTKPINYLAATFTPFLFDIIELQFGELSDSEKADFQNEINSVLESNDIPWLLHEGHMIKIDSLQFEMDLRNKSLMKLSELKDADPKFSSAYSELVKAFEFFEKEEYSEAINNAGKSYESVLKVVCAEQQGNAEKLTKKWSSIYTNALPSVMIAEGFREKVLMSLPYIRNNSGAAHGSGEKDVAIPKHIARLALNLAASLNTFIVEEYMKSLL